MPKIINLPLTDKVIAGLKTGDNVLLSGVLYIARDVAHKRIVDALDKRQKPPFEIKGQTIYYMGPAPNKIGHAIGSAGPTSSYRMDIYSPQLLAAGLKGMIGKGPRTQPVLDAIKKHKAVYFAAIGGAGALISKSIKKSEIIAYEELDAEAVRKIEVENFPVIVINDIYGGDLYREGKAKYKIAKK
jgi:hydro-lyases, Fe-S type, tartrate/fumarate subfamily, beta region